MSSVNKAILIGNLGADPEVRSLQNGNKVVNLRLATTESWRDKNSGERKERTEWHRVVIFSEGLAKVAEQYLKKGSKVYIEGQIQTRKWEKDGQDHYATEIVLQGFNATLTMLDGPSGQSGEKPHQERDEYAKYDTPKRAAAAQAPSFDSGGMDSDIPFAPEWRG